MTPRVLVIARDRAEKLETVALLDGFDIDLTVLTVQAVKMGGHRGRRADIAALTGAVRDSPDFDLVDREVSPVVHTTLHVGELLCLYGDIAHALNPSPERG